jgi:hypothetical protein
VLQGRAVIPKELSRAMQLKLVQKILLRSPLVCFCVWNVFRVDADNHYIAISALQRPAPRASFRRRTSFPMERYLTDHSRFQIPDMNAHAKQMFGVKLAQRFFLSASSVQVAVRFHAHERTTHFTACYT